MNAVSLKGAEMAPRRTKQTEPTPLALQISAYRKKKGLTMQQLADALDITPSYVSFIESGERSPSRKLIRKMVDFFYPQGNPSLQDEWLLLAGFSPDNAIGQRPTNPHAVFEARLQADQTDLRARFALIRSLIKAQEFERALAEIQACFQTYSGTIEVQSLLGSLELAKGNFDLAIAAQNLALQFYFQDPPPTPATLGADDLYLSLGVSYFLKGYQALTAFQQSGQKTSSPKSAQKKSAQASFAQALGCFEKALEISHNDIYIWDEYARVSFNLAHLNPAQATLWEQTIAAYDKVLKHPENRLIGSEALLEAAVFWAHAHSKMGAFAKAEELLALIQAVRPEHPLAPYARACLLSLQIDSDSHAYLANAPDHLEQALVHLAHAFQLDPSGQFCQNAGNDPDLAQLRRLRSKAFAKLCKVVGQRQ